MAIVNSYLSNYQRVYDLYLGNLLFPYKRFVKHCTFVVAHITSKVLLVLLPPSNPNCAYNGSILSSILAFGCV